MESLRFWCRCGSTFVWELGLPRVGGFFFSSTAADFAKNFCVGPR
jgi:hypothetical protein